MPKKNTKPNLYTNDDLLKMQAWPLSRKVQVSQLRIQEWIIKNGNNIYVSFSGGLPFPRPGGHSPGPVPKARPRC